MGNRENGATTFQLADALDKVGRETEESRMNGPRFFAGVIGWMVVPLAEITEDGKKGKTDLLF